MATAQNVRAKVEIIKEMAPEASVKQLAQALLEYIDITEEKKAMGFKHE